MRRPKTDKNRERAMRTRGYADGIAGRPASFPDAAYQTSWRRGREARKAMAKEGRAS